MISTIDVANVYGLVGCVLALFWYYSRSSFGHWKGLNVKYKRPVPFFGNVAKFAFMRQSYHETMAELYAYFRSEPFGGFYQMREPTLLVKDPELVTRVLTTDFKSFVDRGFHLINIDKELNPLSGHLFLANGGRWRILRQRMSPAFSSGKLKLMYEQIFQCVSMMNEFITASLGDGGADFNVKELFQRLTIDVIGTCAFGLECNSLKSDDAFRTKGVQTFEPRLSNSIRMLVSVFNKKLLKTFNMPDLKKEVSDFFLNVALSTLAYRRENGVSRNDLFQMLIELQNTASDPKYSFKLESKNKISTDEQFDEIDVAANAFVFFIAGFETTASTLNYCLYELALNTKIQDRLRSEVERVMAKNNNISPDALKEMSYMDAVISETLRKYPVVPVLNRECTEDYQIPNTKVKLRTGTKLVIPTWSIHHDWKYYPNPELFDPERFNSENKINIISGTYIPFGDGPRYCIGKRFAEMEIKAALADIILKYDFRPCSKTAIPLSYTKGSFVLSPNPAIWLNISKRKL